MRIDSEIIEKFIAKYFPGHKADEMLASDENTLYGFLENQIAGVLDATEEALEK